MEQQIATCGYHDVVELAEGSFGAVYSAKDEKGQLWAIKLMHRNMDLDTPIEIDILCRLRHPRIMAMERILFPTDACLLNGVGFVLPLALSTLESYLPQAHYSTGLGYLGDIACGMEYLHSRGILHLDLKPANILLRLDESGAQRALIADFGLSLYAEGIEKGIPGMSPSRGTPIYTPPENLTGSVIAYRAEFDVWSFGMVALSFFLQEEPVLGFRNLKVNWLTMPLALEERGHVLHVKNNTLVDTPIDELVATTPFTLGMKDPFYLAILLRRTFNPSGKRPSFTEIRQTLQRSEEKGVDISPLHPRLGSDVAKDIRFITEKSLRIDLPCEAYFLAIDLAYRCDKPRPPGGWAWACLSLACKLLNVKFAGNMTIRSHMHDLSKAVLDEREREVIAMLNGVLYPPYLWRACRTFNHLLATYLNIIPRPDRYARVDIAKWIASIPPGEQGKPLTLRQLLEVTVPPYPPDPLDPLDPRN